MNLNVFLHDEKGTFKWEAGLESRTLRRSAEH